MLARARLTARRSLPRTFSSVVHADVTNTAGGLAGTPVGPHCRHTAEEDPKPHFARLILTPSFRQMKHETISVFELFRDALERRESYRCPQVARVGPPPTIASLSADAGRFSFTHRNGVLFAEGDSLLEELNDTIASAKDFHQVLPVLNACLVAARVF